MLDGSTKDTLGNFLCQTKKEIIPLFVVFILVT